MSQPGEHPRGPDVAPPTVPVPTPSPVPPSDAEPDRGGLGGGEARDRVAATSTGASVPASGTTPTPAPEPGAPATPAPPKAPVMERPHPLTPVVKGWMALVAMAVYMVRDYAEHFSERQAGGGPGWWLLGGLLGAYLVVTSVVGYFGWRFTRFVVDDQQVRIEHNFIQHNSDKVPFTKVQSVDVVQPFGARLLGLAQLRIDVGSGRPKTIEYLGRERAYQMRDYLVTRAHGRRVSVTQSVASHRVAGVLGDVADDEQVLLRVPPQRLVVTACLSTSFLVTLVLGIAATSGLVWTRQVGAVVGLVPLLSALVGIIGNGVVKQWNYRLVRAGTALKVTRGMTSLVSQTLPTDRVQALEVTQHLLWRPLGLYRVRMDVLGYGHGDQEEGASNILLPAGTWREVELALEAVWPGFRLDDVPRHPSPPRSRWLHPFIWRSLQWGSTDEVLVARNGGWVRSTKVVHHARVQSVHLRQGPLGRWTHLADLQVDTTGSMLSNLVARCLDERLARELVLAEMDTCRAARRLDARRRALDALPSPAAGGGVLPAVPGAPQVATPATGARPAAGHRADGAQ